MKSLRSKLKNISWIHYFNVKWKAHAVKKAYFETVRYYGSRPILGNASELFEKEAGLRLKKLREKKGRLNFFFLGTDEFQDRSGLLQALEKIGNLSYFTRADGQYGQNDPGPISDRSARNTARLKILFRELGAAGKTPDILLMQTWVGYVEPQALEELKDQYGCLIVNITMDDRHQYWGEKLEGVQTGTFGLIPYLDLTLTAAPEAAQWYLKEGCAALFFPEASDPTIFHPLPSASKVHDVTFVGACYGVRKKIVQALRNAGVRVTTYGSGWPEGRLPVSEMTQLFAQSKIILGAGTIGHSEDFVSLKLRDFDAPMSGSFYLTQENPDFKSLFEVGSEIITYRDSSECIEHAKYFLDHEVEREKIAKAGLERALLHHTWEKRFKTFIDFIGLVP